MGRHQLTVDRLLGESGHTINYRHVIWWLIRKPGAFARYRYQQDLFPSLVFTAAYDALAAVLTPRKADIEYLRILHHAASTMESDVEAALQLLLDEEKVPTADQVKALVSPSMPEIPAVTIPPVDLRCYDGLLPEMAGHEA